MKKILLLYPLIVSIVLLVSCKKSSNDDDITIASTVTYVSGSISLSGPLFSLTPAQAGTPLSQGNTILSDEKSTSLFQMGDEAIIKIQENTSVSLVEIGKKQRTLKLNYGTLVGNVKKINKNDGFLIHMPDMVASVRGTDFLITIIRNEVRISVLDGKIALAQNVSLLQTIDAAIIESGQTCTAKLSGSRKLKKIMSPVRSEDIRIIDTIQNIPFLPNADKRSEKDLNDAMKDHTANFAEPKPQTRTTGQEEILKLGKASIAVIREAFNRIDEITLYSNRVISGIIISRGETFDVITPDGRLKINQRDIKATKIIR